MSTGKNSSVAGKGWYALVTGGSSGMGLEYVGMLSALGYNIIIAALPGTVDPVADRLRAEHPDLDILAIGMNLGQVDSAERLVREIEDKRPGAVIDVLINNAGLINVRHFRDMSLGQIETELMLHNLTTTKLCNLLLPAMKERRRGYVLNVSSLAAWLPFLFISTYAATKAYNRMLTRALRTEYARTGVNVATIYFGAVDTPLFKLSEGKRRLARCLGVMITPQRAAKCALRMLLSGHSGRMPGLINHIAKYACPLLPRPLIAWIDRKASAMLGLK